MAKNKRKNKGQANPERAAAVQELRRSGASGKHADRRTKRLRTRDAQKRNAMKEW